MICLRSPLELNIGTQQYTGYFDDISTQFAMVGFQIPFNQPENRPRSILSVRFSNEQEGVYISRNRAYLGYSFHTRIFNEYFLGGGLEFGSMGYVVEGTPSTGNASKYVIDGAAGISLYSEILTFGLSINQAFNNNVQPLDEVTRLYRHMNAYASYNFVISRNAVVTPGVLFRYPYKTGYNYNLDIGLESVLMEKLLIGSSYRYKNGFSFNAGIVNLKVFNGFLSFNMAYNSPVAASSIKMDIFEFHINYKYFTKKGSASRLPSFP